MSSSNRTPKSVLEAPTSTPVPVSLPLGIIDGQNRHGRRHVPLDAKGKPIFEATAASITIPKAARVAATNVPLTKTERNRRRSKKAIRHALRKALTP